ncbi:MAG: MXAN_5808 family serine peptidase [Myxococcota bacterium]|jgi:carboxyl-terminal processing protease|nr:MXAN_5808 family serine peptidase [Myxococcota bacterium]
MTRTSRFFLAALILGGTLAVTFSHQLGGRSFRLGLGPQHAAARSESYDLRALRILARTALYVQGNYLDQDKVQPRKMLMSSLEKLEWLLPELVVAPAPGEDPESPAAIRVTVGKSSAMFDVGAIDTLWSLRERLKEIITFVQQHKLDQKVKPQELEYAAINGMLSTLDPHSVLLDPEMYTEMKVGTHGEFGGLGIVISIRNHELTVISPLEDTPAWRAGLKAGDVIAQIDDESTVNMRLDNAVERLRGKVGTQVVIWVKRKGWSEPKRFALKREKITIKSVTSKLLADRVGYVKLKSFQGHSQDQVREHLDRMRQQAGGELKGVILDLRGNPGGLLEQAIRISDLFLEAGTIVLTVGKGNTVKEEHKATWNGTEKRYPMVVLVGPGSASASEIVAGALQNNDRALVVGGTTFGKGSVQVLYDMEDGSALKLTIAQYLTPGEVSIQGVGIVPDISLEPVTITKDSIQYYAEERFGEGDLDAHLTNDAAVKKPSSGLTVRYYQDPPPEPPAGEEQEPPPPEDEDDVKEDFEIRFSRGLLAQARSSRSSELLKESARYLATQADTELQRIGETLGTLGIDWSGGDNPSGIHPELTLSTDRPGHRVPAGEKIRLRAQVKNTGAAPLYRLRGITESDNDSLNGLEFCFGKLLPGGERVWEVPVEVGKQVESRIDQVKVQLFSGDDETPLGAGSLLVEIEERQRPRFSYSWAVIDEKTGNGDGLLQRGEKVDFRLFITNQGQGQAEDVAATITNQSGENLFLQQGRQKIEAIPPGGQVEALFGFQVKRKLNEDSVKLQVDVLDLAQREGLEEELEIPVLPEAGRLKPQQGVVSASRPEGAALYAGASEKMPLLGRLRAGSTLPLTGVVGKWLKVDLGGGRSAWTEARSVSIGAGGVAGREPVTLRERMAPLVQFDAATLAQRTTDKARVRITGEALDDQRVQDLYIYTRNRQGKLVKTRKMAFLTNDGPGSPVRLPFSLEVDLKEGVNTVAVVARDNDRLSTLKHINILRLPAPGAAAAAK